MVVETVSGGTEAVLDRTRNIAVALQIVLSERREVLHQLSQECPKCPTAPVDQSTLQRRLAHLTRQQQSLLARLQTVMPPAGNSLV